MFSFITMVEIGDRLTDLISDQAHWSQQTFGLDSERGPIGPLKHLAKEAGEAQTAKKPQDLEEFADCLLLTLDATRRAGYNILELIKAAEIKMRINKGREWPTGKPDEPVEHIR